MGVTWREADLAGLEPAGRGWTHDDAATAARLACSLRRHGQLRPLVVRAGSDGTSRLVDGRRLLSAMRGLGWTRAWVADLGELDDVAAQRLALALEVRFETDYARLAMAVAGLLAAGVAPADLEMASPFTAERIGHFGTLARFDWSQFSTDDGRPPLLEWETEADAQAAAEPEPVVAVPAAVTAGELAREAAAVDPSAPAAEVAAHIREHRRRGRPDQMLLWAE